MIEFEHEQMRHSQSAQERDFVLGGGEQPRTFVRPKNLRRMRIERNDDRATARLGGMPGRATNYRLVSTVHTIKHPDREKDRAGHFRQLRNRSKRAHQWLATR